MAYIYIYMFNICQKQIVAKNISYRINIKKAIYVAIYPTPYYLHLKNLQ